MSIMLARNCIKSPTFNGCKKHHFVVFTYHPLAYFFLTKFSIYFLHVYRKKDLTLFLSGLQNEGIENTMHILLVYLQGSPAAERPLVAALLLYLDLLVCAQNIYLYLYIYICI